MVDGGYTAEDIRQMERAYEQSRRESYKPPTEEELRKKAYESAKIDAKAYMAMGATWSILIYLVVGAGSCVYRVNTQDPEPLKSWIHEALYAALPALCIGMLAALITMWRANSPELNSQKQIKSGESRTVLYIIISILISGVAGVYFGSGSKKTAINNTSGQSVNIRRINTENLNLRAGPGANQSVIMRLPQGTEVIVLNETQNVGGTIWVKVRVGQQEGWLNQRYLQ